jgi:hypothetical protein
VKENHGRDACLRGGPRDPGRLVGVVECERADEVRFRRGKGLDLSGVVCPRLLGAHSLGNDVAVAARPDAAADHDVDPCRGAHRLQELDSPAVDVLECLGRIAESGAPIRIRAPGRRVEDDPHAVTLCDRDVGLVVGAQRRDAVLVVQEDERGELRKLEPVPEDQGGLHSPVGDERAPVELRERRSGRHRATICRSVARVFGHRFGLVGLAL